jgi:hypothetical protein
MVEEKLRYSDADLAEFKEIIVAKIDIRNEIENALSV